MRALDITARLSLLARGDNLDLVDLVCADAIREIKKLRAELRSIKRLSENQKTPFDKRRA